MIRKERFPEYKKYLTTAAGIDELIKRFKANNRHLSRNDYADLIAMISDTSLMTYCKNRIIECKLLSDNIVFGKILSISSASRNISSYRYKDKSFSLYLDVINKKLPLLRNHEDIRTFLNLMNVSSYPHNIIYAYFAIFLYNEGPEEFNNYRLTLRSIKTRQPRIHLKYMDCSLDFSNIKMLKMIKQKIKPAYVLAHNESRIVRNNQTNNSTIVKPKETAVVPVITPIQDKTQVIEIEARWDDIYFDSKAIEIKYPDAYQNYDFRTYSSLRFFNTDSRVWMNYIKPLLARQIGKVRIKINYTKVLEVLTEFNLKKYIDTWNPIINADSYDFVPAWKIKAMSSQTHTENDKFVSLAEKINFKNKFIANLCRIHDSNEKVLTVEENLQWSNSSTKERVFIFTINYHGPYCRVIYENINIARSTYVCTVLRSNYKLAVNSIIDYFNSSFVNKRTDMNSHSVVIRGVSSFKILRHNDLHEWLTRLRD